MKALNSATQFNGLTFIQVQKINNATCVTIVLVVSARIHPHNIKCFHTFISMCIKTAAVIPHNNIKVM